MNEIDILLKKIEELRKEMEKAINARDELLDNEIIELSKSLDEYLVKYHKLLEKSQGKNSFTHYKKR